MNHYEFLGILNGTYADSEVGALISQLEEVIKKHTETIHYVQNLGRRKLAYPIKHQGHGTYVLIEFDAPGEAVKKLDRVFRLTNELLRHCIVRRKTVGAPLPLERKEEERMRPHERASTRKVLGEELLGETIMPVQEPSTPEEKPAEVGEVTPPTVSSSPMTDDTGSDSVPDVVITAIPTPTDDAAGTPTKTDEEETPEESAKKKNKKVSYEELDKKLNELLSDDIL